MPSLIKEYPVCTTCSSADTSKDAWASWNIEKQEWELENTFDYSHCNNCEGECTLKWISYEEEIK